MSLHNIDFSKMPDSPVEAVFSQDSILREHVLLGYPVLPAASMIELVGKTAFAAGYEEITLENIVFSAPGLLCNNRVEVEMTWLSNMRFQIRQLRMILSVGRMSNSSNAVALDIADLTNKIKKYQLHMIEILDRPYDVLEKIGYNYGDSLKGLDSIYDSKEFWFVNATDELRGSSVALTLSVDIMIQALFVIGAYYFDTKKKTPIPIGIEEINFCEVKFVPRIIAVPKKSVSYEDNVLRGNIYLLEEKSDRAIKIKQIRVRFLSDEFLKKSIRMQIKKYKDVSSSR